MYINDRIIYNINQDIRLLERNKELSFKNNHTEKYLAILDELEKKNKILNIFIHQKERTKIKIDREYYSNIQIETNYNDYLSNFK